MSSLALDDTETHDEGYFASFTDLLVGVLFIFIILLMVFASNFNEATEKVTGMTQSRDVVLEEIEKSLRKQGVPIQIDKEQGLLRLPESVLFDRSKSTLSPKGNNALKKLAEVLRQYLPCLAQAIERDAIIEAGCDALHLKSRDGLETVLIEGHTDITGTDEFNWSLSAQRAITVFQTITRSQPILNKGIVNTHDLPVLAVSGYAARRPVPGETPQADKNRRIDLRFIMRSPTPEDVKNLQRTVH